MARPRPAAGRLAVGGSCNRRRLGSAVACVGVALTGAFCGAFVYPRRAPTERQPRTAARAQSQIIPRPEEIVPRRRLERPPAYSTRRFYRNVIAKGAPGAVKPVTQGYYYGSQPDTSTPFLGPYRHLYMQSDIWQTLWEAVDLDGPGQKLRGRYRNEVKAWLEVMENKWEFGEENEVTVYWDHENVKCRRPDYTEFMRVYLTRHIGFFTAFYNRTTTRIEAVRIARTAGDHADEYLMGGVDWLTTLKQMGGIVHRTWPPKPDAVDDVLLERMSQLIEDVDNGAPRPLVLVLSGDRGFVPMITSMQNEGITVMFADDHGTMYFYPGGLDFSIKLSIPIYDHISFQNFVPNAFRGVGRVKPFKSLEDRTPREGTALFNFGPIELTLAPEEELDRRFFHSWDPQKFKKPPQNHLLGTWKRHGIPLDSTLDDALQGIINNESLSDEVRDAVAKDMQDLFLAAEEGKWMELFWNYQTMGLDVTGKSNKTETLGRITRWLEGYTGLKVGGVEVTKYMEPWDRPGAHPSDYMYYMDKLGMKINGVWPIAPEGCNFPLSESIGNIATAVKEAGSIAAAGAPRLIVIFSKEFCFDMAMRAAQEQGITVLLYGYDGDGLLYPANTKLKVKMNVLNWETAIYEVKMTDCNPFTPGASLPGAPRPLRELWVTGEGAVPIEHEWGRPKELLLDAPARRLELAAGRTPEALPVARD